MAVYAKATSTRGAIIGDVIDMPSPDVLIVMTSKGAFYVHDSEVTEFFYA